MVTVWPIGYLMARPFALLKNGDGQDKAPTEIVAPGANTEAVFYQHDGESPFEMNNESKHGKGDSLRMALEGPNRTATGKGSEKREKMNSETLTFGFRACLSDV